MFFLGALGALFVESAVLPELIAHERTRHLPFVRNIQERTTIIERTENVHVTHDKMARDVLTQLRESIVRVTSTYAGTTRSGSGVFVTSDGVVAVAGSVLFDAPQAKVTVTLASGDVFDAVHIERDTVTDIAFIKIDAPREYPVVSFARVEDLFAGQWLVEAGVDMRVRDHMYAFTTQMQAYKTAVSESTSFTWDGVLEVVTTRRDDGAVLFTHRGDLAAIAFYDGDNATVMPANAVSFALQRFLDNRSQNVIDLGITYKSVDGDVHKKGIHENSVIIETVNAINMLAGVQSGDYITKIDGEELSFSRTLPVIIDEKRNVKKVDVTIVRDGIDMIIPLTIQEKTHNLTPRK